MPSGEPLQMAWSICDLHWRRTENSTVAREDWSSQPCGSPLVP